jgi:endonuclease G
MSFPGYLTAEPLNALLQKAIDSGLVEAEREIYLNGIYRSYALALPEPATRNRLNQFSFDLIAINRAERLVDGQVPIVQFLKNCASWLRIRGLPGADDFEREANAIANRSGGVQRLPDPAAIREITQNEAIIGVDDMVDFPFLAAGAQVGRSVARILVPRFENDTAIQAFNGAPWLMVGTAWAIAKDLVVTNHHVINARTSEEPMASAEDFKRQGLEAQVEFDLDAPGAVPKTVKITEIVATSADLDYAILRLAETLNRPALKIGSTKVQFLSATYLPVNIIQHPRGLSKRVAFRNNLVTGADDQIVRYFTDTDYGSSGSPVCDDAWQVVALHRGAKFVTGVKFQGRNTAYINFGTQIQAVLVDLEVRNAAVRSEIA